MKKITNDLKSYPKEKTEVYIYPSIENYHNEMGRPNAPQWQIGSEICNKIFIVSPKNPGNVHTYDSILQATVHEFTHAVVENIAPNIFSVPLWLNEGIAVYEADQKKKIKYHHYLN